jgi:hypothetical protein
LTIEVLKNQASPVTSLITEQELQGLVVQAVGTRCHTTTFTILKPDGSEVAATDSLYSLLDVANRVTNDIMIDSTVALTDGTVISVDHSFRVRAVASGGASIEKEITAKIIVCGWEQISLVSS